MKFCFFIILVMVTATKYSNTYPCFGQTCDSTCTGSSCCRDDSCRENCCCQSTATYRTRSCCEPECCKKRNCCDDKSCKCPCPPDTTTTTTTTTVRPYPPGLPAPCPLGLTTPCPPSSSTCCNNTITNQNNNTIIIPTNITIQNEVRSETHITIPVNVSVDNTNNIHISSSKSDYTSGEGGDKATPSSTTSTTVTPVTSKTPVKLVPYPVPVPIYYVIIIPEPRQFPSGCCHTVQPCIPYHYCGCHTSSFHCSHKCSYPYTYQPIDVCFNGCYRRDTAIGQQCSYGGCHDGHVDCSSCDTNFFHSYDGFLRCAGCFVPMSWGNIGLGQRGLGAGGIFGG